MKYIGNAFSTSMLNSTENIIKVTTITKEAFLDASKTSKSIIGHPEIANNFNLELNRESIILNKGDVLYIVVPLRRPMEHQKVENGAKYEFIPESEGYKYQKIEVID